MRLALLFATALMLFWRCGTLAQAQPIDVSIPIEDATIMEAHRHNNDGGWGYAWVKTGNGRNRVVFRADLSPLAGLVAEDVLSASLVLRVLRAALRTQGTAFSLHRDDPSAPAGLAWIEGVGRFDHMSGYCNQGQWWRPSVRVPLGAGVTWNCAADPVIADSKTLNCALPWAGGFPGFLATPATTVTIIEPPGEPCVWPFVIPLTEDIRAAVAEGAAVRSWLWKRTDETGGEGSVHVFSREGAICVAGQPAYAPALVVTLREGVTAGSVSALPDPCAAAGY